MDLDGTILDISSRYYTIYKELLLESGYLSISKSKYWKAKREQISEFTILSWTNAESIYLKYKIQRQQRIENEQYLKLDRIHNGVIKKLKLLRENNVLFLITLRKTRKSLLNQLVSLKLEKYFNHIYLAKREMKPRWKMKYLLLKKFIDISNRKRCIIIGDTESDIIAGKSLDLITIAICNGIRNRKFLEQLNPDLILEQFSDIKESDFI